MRRRIDAVLTERGLFQSREQARAAILAGEVRVGDVPVTKAGHLIDDDARITVAERQRYVSRGGIKLAGALAAFGLDVSGAHVIDVGASTGGFTDCLLQSGAGHVVALDVGYGQLAWVLRTDPRVTVIERTNIRNAEGATLGAPFDLAVIDVSFISLSLVLPHVVPMLSVDGELLALVKPQFEAGKGHVGKKGVVREAGIHEDVLRAAAHAVEEAGLVVRGMTFSPAKGPEGNIEFWVWASRVGAPTEVTAEMVVADAHETLGG